MGLTLRLTACEDWTHPLCMSCCEGVTPQSRIHHCGLWSLPTPPFGCAACGTNWVVVFCCGLNPDSRCVGSGAPWEGLLCREGQLLPVTSRGLPGGR